MSFLEDSIENAEKVSIRDEDCPEPELPHENLFLSGIKNIPTESGESPPKNTQESTDGLGGLSISFNFENFDTKKPAAENWDSTNSQNNNLD